MAEEPEGLAGYRVAYPAAPLAPEDLASGPLASLMSWFADAERAGVPEPNAMVVSTADAEGRPSARTVLLKGADARGLAFFTNLGSRKSRELAQNHHAAAVLPWYAIHRQVCVVGRVVEVARDEAAAYFASRPRDSQIGAWVSRQSSVLPDREALDARLAEVLRRFGDGPVPLPDFWGGWRIVPDTVEFWQGRESRLHDRLRFRRIADTAGLDDPTGWILERLSP